MQTAIEYLEKTESAMRKLFEGIDSYLAPLRRSRSAFESSTADDEKRRVERDTWFRQNKSAIAASFANQREFVAESFAQAVLCGAILQVATKAIEMYSVNSIVPLEWGETKGMSKKNVVKFCYGRPVRGIPLGLVVYAGRNQHTHFQDEKGLHEPSKTDFERLATRKNDGHEVGYRDPAFDLANDRLVSFASNITELLGWQSYEAYNQDIRSMLKINGQC